MAVLEALLFGLAVTVAALVLFLLGYAVFCRLSVTSRYAIEYFGSVTDNIRERAEQGGYRREAEAREQEFLDWVETKIKAGNPTDALDYDVLRARTETPKVRQSVEEILPDR